MEKLVSFYSGKRVLVTGHTGFKGAWLSLWLNHLGASVTGYSLEPPTTPAMSTVTRLAEDSNTVTGDIRDQGLILKTFDQARPEVVFHLAAQSLVRASYTDPVETFSTNVMGTVSVLEACRRTPSVKAVVIATSDKCYENNGHGKPFVESDPMGGHDPYSASKGCTELVCQSYLKSFFSDSGAPGIATVRAGNVLGGGDWAKDRLVPDCLAALATGQLPNIRRPEAVRPWQHVLEPLYGYALLAQALYGDRSYSGPWNFGPGPDSEWPVRDVVETLVGLWQSGAKWGLDIATHPHEAQHLSLDSSKARRELGWRPRWALKHTLEETVAWHKAYLDGSDMKQFTLGQIDAYMACPPLAL